MPEETLNPAGTTTATSTVPEELLDPNVIQRMIYEIDPSAIRAEVERLISKPRCAAFVKELIKRAEETAPPNNKIVAGGDVLKIFDLVMAQKRFIRFRGPESDPRNPPNCALGRMCDQNAGIQIGNYRPGKPVTSAELKQLYPLSDAKIVLHELIHHSGERIYDDEHLSRVVRAMIEDVDSLDEHSAHVVRRMVRDKKDALPTTGKTLDFSFYWDQALTYSYS